MLPVNAPTTPPPRRALAGLLALLFACSGEGPEPSAPTSAAAPPAPAPSEPELPAQLPRSDDPRLAGVARAIEEGELEAANGALLGLPQGLDRELLTARLYAAEGDAISAVRTIEAARERWPDQGRVYGTAAEIHAASGRTESAEAEIREGLAVAGPVPALARARGVLALIREGGAALGLEHLLDARERDPGIWFTERPLFEAHLLLGNAAMGAEEPLEALGHARAALAAAPDEPEARQLEADALAAMGEFEPAISIYEALCEERPQLASTLALLCQRGATAALLKKERDVAIERYLRARDLGLSDEELGFGAAVLQEEAKRAIERGLDAYDTRELEAARGAFERATRLDPNQIEAFNHLGVVHFRLGDPGAAAVQWRTVLELARTRGIDLPEPVHLNLARALYQADRKAEVRPLLEDWLRRHPDGEWETATREMLARLAEEGI